MNIQELIINLFGLFLQILTTILYPIIMSFEFTFVNSSSYLDLYSYSYFICRYSVLHVRFYSLLSVYTQYHYPEQFHILSKHNSQHEVDGSSLPSTRDLPFETIPFECALIYGSGPGDPGKVDSV